MSERKTMDDVRFYLDRANEALEELGITNRKLSTYQAYGTRRIVWRHDSTAMSDVGFNGTVRENYDTAYALASVLEHVAYEQRRNAVTREYDLSATYDSRKSFYGKARVKHHANGTCELYSYNTLVCIIKHGTAYRAENQPQSATTARHMSEFLCQNIGMLDGHQYSKRDLLALPTFN